MDTCGFPKDDYWYYQAWWGNQPVLHLAPHWNWAYRPGAEIEVRCTSNCDRVELLLNGKGQGVQEMKPLSHLSWKVKWERGVLSAKGFKGDKLVATTQVETTGPPAALKLTPDRATIKADGEDVSLVTVTVVDGDGRTVPTADNEVSFEVSPNARLIGVGNGNPSSLESDQAPRRRAFNGLCLAIVQATRQAGPIRLTATSGFASSSPGAQARSLTSPELAPATATIQAQRSTPRPSVPER